MQYLRLRCRRGVQRPTRAGPALHRGGGGGGGHIQVSTVKYSTVQYSTVISRQQPGLASATDSYLESWRARYNELRPRGVKEEGNTTASWLDGLYEALMGEEEDRVLQFLHCCISICTIFRVYSFLLLAGRKGSAGLP